MNYRLREICKGLLIIVCFACLIGALSGLAWSASLGLPNALGLMRGFLSGLLAGLLIGGGEIALDRSKKLRRLRRYPLWTVLLLRLALYTIGVTLCFEFARMWATDWYFGTGMHFKVDAQFFGSALLGSSLAILIAITYKITPLIGFRRMLRLVAGAYQRPQKVEKIIVFMDLVGSTGLAEIIGDRDFFRFLNDSIMEMTEPIVQYSGQIYRYAGDSVVLVWNEGKESEAIECVFGIEEAFKKNRRKFERRYKTVPRYRFGIHKGSVVVGELGDMHLEVAIMGDTINTAQRIEDLCRQQDYNVMASDEVMEHVKLPETIKVHPLEDVTLRGKARKIKLVGLVKAES